MTAEAEKTPVVVGADGSDSSLDAVRLAAREAVLMGRPLHVVHAFVWDLMRVPLGPHPLGPPDGGLENEARRILADAVQVASTAEPRLTVHSRLIDGAALGVLLRAAEEASMLVLGDRGLGAISGALIGSVAIGTVRQAHCPVLVARSVRHLDGTVVLGVDGTEVSGAATQFAFAEAGRRRAPLTVVHAGTSAVLRHRLTVSMETLAKRYPRVEWELRLSPDSPARALIGASKDAGLIVVGSRGRGSLAGFVTGSVSHSLLYHADCTVAVVREEAG